MPSAAPGFDPKSSGSPERGTMREGIFKARLVYMFVLVGVFECARVLSFVSVSNVLISSFSLKGTGLLSMDAQSCWY